MPAVHKKSLLKLIRLIWLTFSEENHLNAASSPRKHAVDTFSVTASSSVIERVAQAMPRRQERSSAPLFKLPTGAAIYKPFSDETCLYKVFWLVSDPQYLVASQLKEQVHECQCVGLRRVECRVEVVQVFSYKNKQL